MQTLELNGLQELKQEELKIIDGGEIVNGYSDASARSAGKALYTFFVSFGEGITDALKNCKC